MIVNVTYNNYFYCFLKTIDLIKLTFNGINKIHIETLIFDFQSVESIQ